MVLPRGATTLLTVFAAASGSAFARSSTCRLPGVANWLSAPRVLGFAGANTPPTGATRPTSFVAGSSTGLIGASEAAGARSRAAGDEFDGRGAIAGCWDISVGISTETGVFRRTRSGRGATTGRGSVTACALTGSGAAGAESAGASAPTSTGAPTAPPDVSGVGLSRGALSLVNEPSPTCVAPTNTEPQASRVPAAIPQARPRRIALPPTGRSPGALPTTETDVLVSVLASGATPRVRVPPTQAIRAVAEGPEPDFLRRRAVIVRHHRSPQGSGLGEEYRFSGVCPDLSLSRRSTPESSPGSPAVPRACSCQRSRCAADYVRRLASASLLSLPLLHFRVGFIWSSSCICARVSG